MNSNQPWRRRLRHSHPPGAYRTGPLTEHTRTHIDVLKRFLDIEIDVEEDGDMRTIRLWKR